MTLLLLSWLFTVKLATLTTMKASSLQRLLILQPTGSRTICLLTFVDLALNDSGLFQKNVIDLLNKTSRTFIAVKGPLADEHETISHAQARQQEREFFAAKAWSGVPRESISTGSLVTILVKRYFNAMKETEAPLNKEILAQRTATKAQLSLIPESAHPQQVFSELWMSIEFCLMDSLKTGDSGSVEPLSHCVSSIHLPCKDRLDKVLMRVPATILQGNDEDTTIEMLVKIVKSTTGVMLPNFKPFPPLEAFFKICATGWFNHVVEEMVEHVHEILNDYIKAAISHKQAQMDADGSLADAFNLLRSELRSVADDMSDRISVSLYELSKVICHILYFV